MPIPPSDRHGISPVRGARTKSPDSRLLVTTRYKGIGRASPPGPGMDKRRRSSPVTLKKQFGGYLGRTSSKGAGQPVVISGRVFCNTPFLCSADVGTASPRLR